MTAVVLVFSPVFLVIDLAAFIFGIITIVDMARRPGWQWQQAGSSKPLWLVLEIVFLLVFSLISIILGIIYFLAIRPRLVAVESQAGRSPWSPSPRGTWEQSSQTPWAGQGGPGPGGPWPTASYPPPPAPGTEDAAPPPPPDVPPAYPSPGAPAYPSPGAPGAPPAPGQVFPPQQAPPFGWYPDPSGRHEQRYWDGTRWTEHVRDGGQDSTEVLPG